MRRFKISFTMRLLVKRLLKLFMIVLTKRKFTRYEILERYGQISHDAAKEKAIGEYKVFNKHQKIVSDFDKEIKKIQGDQK